MGDRVKVACINWGHPDAPHALIYLLRNGEAIAERFVPTWDDAMALVPRYARATRDKTPCHWCREPAFNCPNSQGECCCIRCYEDGHTRDIPPGQETP